MEQRRARQQKEAEDRERAEQEQREMELLEMEVAEGLLMMNIPTSVATQTEVKCTVNTSAQTETHTRSIETQTQTNRHADTQTQTNTHVDTQTQTTGSQPSIAVERVPVSNALSAVHLKENDPMTRFYTGLPKWALFVQVFSLLSSFITPSRTKITLQDELILVLVKLRLNLPFQDLAYR